MTAFHPEVMPPTQQAVLRLIGPFAAERGFYLAGGTALAIRLGHRRSVDLHWFTPESIHPMALAADLKGAGLDFTMSEEDKGTLHGTVQGVKLSFLEYAYPDVSPPVMWPEYQVRLASLEDIACIKLSAVGARGERKDFVDIYALGRDAGLTLGQMLSLYSRKYGVADHGHTVFALTSFDDAEQDDPPAMIWPVGWDEVKSSIEEWLRDYMEKAGTT